MGQTEDIEKFQNYHATHDLSLREELILRYIPLVYYVLGRLNISKEIGPEYEDLVSQGLLGLIEAVDRFDPEMGNQFSTYATFRIRGKVLDYFRSIDVLSRTARHRTREIQNAITGFWQTKNRIPTDEELAETLHLEITQVQKALMDSTRVIVSIDTFDDTGEDSESSFHEALVDPNQINPSELFDMVEAKQILTKALGLLSDREQLVLSLYYYEELTLKEIAVVLEVSESRVCQLHSRAIMNLKAILSSSLPVKKKIGMEKISKRPMNGYQVKNGTQNEPNELPTDQKNRVTYV
jgi:RNA polymerase sigma factor FliA